MVEKINEINQLNTEIQNLLPKIQYIKYSDLVRKNLLLIKKLCDGARKELIAKSNADKLERKAKRLQKDANLGIVRDLPPAPPKLERSAPIDIPQTNENPVENAETDDISD